MKSKLFLLFVSSLILTNCQNQKAKPEQLAPVPAPESTFSGSMQELQQTLTEILPIVADPELYSKPENQKSISADVKKLMKLSENVKHSDAVTLKDPSVAFISKAFSEDLARIDESLSLGKKDYARYSLMNLTSYCIECHTRTSTGPSFRSPALEQSLKKLSPLERGEFLIATRQFEAALKEFSTVIDTKINSQGDFAGLDKAVQHSLAVTVKYLKDSKRALSIIEKLKKARGIPYYLKQNSLGWEAAIQDWMKEPPASDNTAEGILKRVRTWIGKGQQLQVGMVDRGGDIYFLRALSELHLLLVSKLSAEQRGEALFLTGLSFEATKDNEMINLHENYYESCIRKVPHSVWAKKCYKRYEESVYFGYTGSSGVQLPQDVAKKIRTLRSLAFQPEEEQ